MRRLLTAVVLIPLIAYVVLWAHFYLFLLVTAAVAVLCFREYSSLVAGHNIDPPGPVGYAAGLLVLLIAEPDVMVLTALAALVFLLLLGSADHSRSLPKAGALMLGVVYIFGAWRTGIELRAASPYWLFFVLALNWVGDAAAYYVGRAAGRHRLAPRLSPAKSWEGSLASLAVSVAFGLFFLERWIPGVSVLEALALSAAGNISGQVGDLVESAMKRGAGLKDSGNLLPGHGGWLDRVDGTLFSLPVVYWLQVALEKM